MIKPGTPFPTSFHVQSRAFCQGWRLVTGLESAGLDKRLREKGWLFVSIATQFSATAFGFGEHKTMQAAFRKIVKQAEPMVFNCVEITQAAPIGLMGFTIARLAGRPRNVQERAK